MRARNDAFNSEYKASVLQLFSKSTRTGKF